MVLLPAFKTFSQKTHPNYFPRDQSLSVHYHPPGTDCMSAQLVTLYRGTFQWPYHKHLNHSLFQLGYTCSLKTKQQAQLHCTKIHHMYTTQNVYCKQNLHVHVSSLPPKPHSQLTTVREPIWEPELIWNTAVTFNVEQTYLHSQPHCLHLDSSMYHDMYHMPFL